MFNLSINPLKKIVKGEKFRSLYLSALPLSTGFAGTLITFFLTIPMPALLGPMLVNGAISLSGFRMRVSKLFFPPVFITIGIYIGSKIQADYSNFSWTWVFLTLFVFLWMILAILLGAYYMQRFAKMDKLSAVYSSVPGAFASIVAYSQYRRFDERRVFLTQTFRIFLVISLLPILLSLFANDLQIYYPEVRAEEFGIRDIITWGLCILTILIITYGLQILKVPSPYLIAGIIGSGIFFTSGQLQGPLPNPPIIIALYILGSILGTRFSGFGWREVFRIGLHSALSSIILISFCVLGAWLAYWATGINFLSLLLVFAPGGINEISIIAYTYGLDLALVVLIHVVRITTITFSLPLIPRLLKINIDTNYTRHDYGGNDGFSSSKNDLVSSPEPSAHFAELTEYPGKALHRVKAEKQMNLSSPDSPSDANLEGKPNQFPQYRSNFPQDKEISERESFMGKNDIRLREDKHLSGTSYKHQDISSDEKNPKPQWEKESPTNKKNDRGIPIVQPRKIPQQDE